jgi:hypothetical protein
MGSTQPAVQWDPRDLSPGIKRLERENNPSPAATSEMKCHSIVPATCRSCILPSQRVYVRHVTVCLNSVLTG